MRRPRLILADEPTGNLDPETGERVTSLLLDLNREVGSALVVVTHNDRLAAAMERTLRLTGGRVHEEATREIVRQGGMA
jgi:predicted ABC-type transport system involved in lysophospholipase L1 biosynthesis ATPase subunit